MTHSFFGTIFSGQHYAQPFTCPCGEVDPNRMHKHSLTLSQKIAVFAIALIVAIPTYGIGGIAAFYVLTAAFKARNSVWTVYTSECYDMDRYVVFIPDWWGVSRNRRRFTYSADIEKNSPYKGTTPN